MSTGNDDGTEDASANVSQENPFFSLLVDAAVTACNHVAGNVEIRDHVSHDGGLLLADVGKGTATCDDITKEVLPIPYEELAAVSTLP